jgi:signal transduction histidine kinase
VVVVALAPAFVARFFSQADLGRQGVITLIGNDGLVLARAAAGTALASQEQGASDLLQEMRGRRNGQVRRVSSFDGIERLVGFRALDGYPLFALTARGADEVYAASRSRGQLWLAMGALVTLVIAVLTLNVLRRSRQQAELLQALSLSRQKAEMAQELKSRFLLDVADGMRGPMMSIIDRAEHLRDTHTDPQARGQARLIHESAQQLCDRFSTLFDPCGPATLDADTLSGAPLEQAGGGLRVDTAFDSAETSLSPPHPEHDMGIRSTRSGPTKPSGPVRVRGV